MGIPVPLDLKHLSRGPDCQTLSPSPGPIRLCLTVLVLVLVPLDCCPAVLVPVLVLLDSVPDSWSWSNNSYIIWVEHNIITAGVVLITDFQLLGGRKLNCINCNSPLKQIYSYKFIFWGMDGLVYTWSIVYWFWWHIFIQGIFSLCVLIIPHIVGVLYCINDVNMILNIELCAFLSQATRFSKTIVTWTMSQTKYNIILVNQLVKFKQPSSINFSQPSLARHVAQQG